MPSRDRPGGGAGAFPHDENLPIERVEQIVERLEQLGRELGAADAAIEELNRRASELDRRLSDALARDRYDVHDTLVPAERDTAPTPIPPEAASPPNHDDGAAHDDSSDPASGASGRGPRRTRVLAAAFAIASLAVILAIATLADDGITQDRPARSVAVPATPTAGFPPAPSASSSVGAAGEHPTSLPAAPTRASTATLTETARAGDAGAATATAARAVEATATARPGATSTPLQPIVPGAVGSAWDEIEQAYGKAEKRTNNTATYDGGAIRLRYTAGGLAQRVAIDIDRATAMSGPHSQMLKRLRPADAKLVHSEIRSPGVLLLVYETGILAQRFAGERLDIDAGYYSEEIHFDPASGEVRRVILFAGRND